ncbi:hypothetical protein [Halobacillus sp. Cin3]|uniref:hypothetical protein n=1 Tax=Halobacillus sp. Cin3 TaxID=2928441 RepID=UPI00248ED23F|nr:hypothetical protein [Halobacillus sp. Cin3]
MIDLSRDGYSHEQIRQMLHMAHGSREVRFRYDLLDNDDNFIAELDTVEGGNIEFSAFSDIKRTAKIHLREETYLQEAYMSWGDIGDKKWSEV